MTNSTCFSIKNTCETDNKIPDFPKLDRHTYIPRFNLIPLPYSISERVNSFSRTQIEAGFYEVVKESNVVNRLLMTDCDLTPWELGYIGIPNEWYKEEPIYISWDTMSDNDVIVRILGQIPVTTNELVNGKKYMMYPYPDRQDEKTYAVGVQTQVSFSSDRS